MSPTTSPFGPLAVLLDPRAGHGVVAREVDAVEHALEARGLEYRLHVGGTSQELRDLSAAALDEGYRFLAAVGDDGTVQDVVNGMFREGRPIVEAPVLGVVAADSGSDLPLSFGLPGDTERAIGHLAGADTYPFDLMKIAVTGPDGARDGPLRAQRGGDRLPRGGDDRGLARRGSVPQPETVRRVLARVCADEGRTGDDRHGPPERSSSTRGAS